MLFRSAEHDAVPAVHGIMGGEIQGVAEDFLASPDPAYGLYFPVHDGNHRGDVQHSAEGGGVV